MHIHIHVSDVSRRTGVWVFSWRVLCVQNLLLLPLQELIVEFLRLLSDVLPTMHHSRKWRMRRKRKRRERKRRRRRSQTMQGGGQGEEGEGRPRE